MTGRGVDQILAHPCDPVLCEPAVADARTYVGLAEQINGPIEKPVDVGWPWGEALRVLDEASPHVRLINLETSITGDGEFAAGKAVHYRMHPNNIGCVTVARPDICVLANNHVLDFGPAGLADTLDALARAGIPCVGAGLDATEAECPAVVDLTDGARVIVTAAGMRSSGIPHGWAATPDRPGVAFAPDLSTRTATSIADRVAALKRRGDIAIASLHWGSNWGYTIESGQVRFAHRLIDAGVDVVHGHSSHHPRPIEVYRGKLILYGCGDLVNDYEGIGGYEPYRDDLRLLYFASIDPRDGTLTELRMVPMRPRRMRLERATHDDARWLRDTLQRTSERFGTRVDVADDAVTVAPV